MIEKPQKGRAIIIEGFNNLEIQIPQKKNWFVIIFFTAWLGGWFMGESFAISTVFNSDTPIFANLFILFWLIGWTVGGSFAAYSLFWMTFGKEKIIVNRNTLSLQKSLFSFLNKEYDLYEISDIRLNPDSDSPYGNFGNKGLSFGNSGGKLKFDYGMKTIKFANSIDEAEAKYLLNIFKKSGYFKDINFEEKSEIDL